MAFDDVPADAYARFMGRFSTPLSTLFADLALAGVSPLTTALDVGCGPGMLTGELVERLGQPFVAAVDPAPAFVAAAAAAFPAVDVQQAAAESIPHPDGAFDATLAQLVVQFMSDPRQGVAEMARVTRPGGRVAACVWDHGGGRGPLSTFWRAARRLRGDTTDEQHQVGATRGDLERLLGEAGLDDARESELSVTIQLDGFDDWWTPYTYGVGPAGDHVASLAPDDRAALEQALRDELGEGAFAMTAVAWAATGTVRG